MSNDLDSDQMFPQRSRIPPFIEPWQYSGRLALTRSDQPVQPAIGMRFYFFYNVDIGNKTGPVKNRFN
jgi:hypothetical protein